jgi:predicted extracellular nuclease
VISQVFGGGGNSGAPFRNDFIEILNAGTSPVNLNGWSVQYASATASTWAVTQLNSITLNPGQYYLIQESSGGSNGASLLAPDATGTIAMAAGSGKVVLIKPTSALTVACPNDPNIVDLVGYGSTANCVKGSAPAPTPSNTNAILRAAAGCTDTRNNVADFALGPPNPRNSKFLPRICTDP